jgi:hypothetical protein
MRRSTCDIRFLTRIFILQIYGAESTMWCQLTPGATPFSSIAANTWTQVSSIKSLVKAHTALHMLMFLPQGHCCLLLFENINYINLRDRRKTVGPLNGYQWCAKLHGVTAQKTNYVQSNHRKFYPHVLLQFVINIMSLYSGYWNRPEGL